MEDFYAAVELAKKIEKSAIPHSEFSDRIEVVKTLDFEPAEFEGLTYNDLTAMYERIEKIMRASKLLGGIPSAPAVEKAKAREVETRVKEITTETLLKAEEISLEFEKKAEEVLPAPQEKPPEEISLLELEKPKEKGELVVEREVEKPAIEKPSYPPRAVKEEKVGIAKTIVETRPIEEKPEVGAVAVPAILEAASADEAANAKYAEIEEYLGREWGGAVDYEKVRKKMLDLTKDLFKEKTTSGRERIKLEITVLKNMLVRIKEGGAARAKTAMPKAEYSQNMMETLKSTQPTELSSIKDEINSSIVKQVNSIKNTFFDSIKGLADEDAAGKKAAYDKLVFDLTGLNEQLPQVLKKSEDFLTQKHIAELRNLSASLGKGDVRLAKEVEAQIDDLSDRYKKEFMAMKEIISKLMDSITDAAANEVFGKEEKEARVSGMVYEINETDEGTLLYYLHSKDLEYYKQYERNHVSKGDALHKAKMLMAKEKGLSDDAITKYFGKAGHQR